MADDKYTLIIDADGKPFLNELNKVEKEVEKTAGGISGAFKDAFKIKSVGDLVLGLGGAAKAASFVSEQLKKVGQAIFNTVLEGEKVLKVEKQFSLLADQAGQFGNDLQASLKKAGKGLIDTTDILKASSAAFVQLGENAQRLPETLELSTKIVKVFGGEVVDVYTQLNTAIASGATRSLKELGIIVDKEKAYSDFAKSIGTTVDLLTQEQRQFALTNAVLEKGKKSFENITAGGNSVTASVKQLGVAYQDLQDAVAVATAKTFGPAFASAIQSLTSDFKRLGFAIKEATVGLSETESYDKATDSIKRLNTQREKFTRGGAVNEKIYAGEIKVLDDLIYKQRQQIAIADEANEKAFERALRQQKASPSKPSGSDALGLTPEQAKFNSDKLLAVQKEFQAQQISLRQQGIAIELSDAQLIQDEKLRNAELDRIAEEQKILQTAIFEQQKLDIKTKFAGASQLATEQRNILEQEAEQNHQDTLNQIEAASAERKLAQQKRLNEAFSGIVKSGFVNAFKSVGEALAKGENALKAFGNGILALIGNILIEIGSSFILIGKGIEAVRASIVTVVGGPSIAAGIALIVLGGLLSSLSGGSKSTPSSGGSTASGSTSADTVADDLNEDIQEKQTNVKIEVGGTVLDPISVGLQISDILTQTFSATGTKVVVS